MEKGSWMQIGQKMSKMSISQFWKINRVISYLKIGIIYLLKLDFPLLITPSKFGSRGFFSPIAFHFTDPSSPPSDCRRLRFSLLADTVRLINSHIIIIIIIIIIDGRCMAMDYSVPRLAILVSAVLILLSCGQNHRQDYRGG